MKLGLPAVAFLALAMPANAPAAVFLLFDRAYATPNDRVVVRAVGAEAPLRLYLVRDDAAAGVHTRFDRRLAFVGVLRGARLTFSVPPVDAGTYTLAYWCPKCAPYSRGRTFFVQEPAGWVLRYRARGLLRIRAGAECPVTLPNGNRPLGWAPSPAWHGNGLLWTKLSPDGVYSVAPERVDPDGSIGNKLYWVTTPRAQAPVLTGERLDERGPRMVAEKANRGPSDFMVPVSFPSAGCWRITARVADRSLTYVVRVVVR